MSKFSAKLSDSLKDNAARLKDNASDLSERAGERLSAAKEKGSDLVATGKEKLSHGVEVTREKANAAAEKGKETFEANTLAVVAGGLVLGAVVAALLPTTERERNKLGGTSAKLKDKVKTAANAAKDTAAAKMEETGLNAETIKGQIGDIVSKGLDILKEASKAAGDAAKK